MWNLKMTSYSVQPRDGTDGTDGTLVEHITAIVKLNSKLHC